MQDTVPGEKWHATDAEKKLIILDALLKGKKRYMEIWYHVRSKIGSKHTFQLYLSQLEEEGLIERRKLSHKRVEFDLHVTGKKRRDLVDKLLSAGLTEDVRKLPYRVVGYTEGPLHSLAVNDTSLNEVLCSDIPRWVEKIDFTIKSSFDPELPYAGLPAFIFLADPHFKEMKDEQFFVVGLPWLLDILLIKIMDIKAQMHNADRANPLEWLRKALDFEVVIAFKLSGKELLKSLDMEKIRKQLELSQSHQKL